MAEYERNECVYKKVAMQEAEERHLRDKELQKTRVIWQEQMKVKIGKRKTIVSLSCTDSACYEGDSRAPNPKGQPVDQLL